LLNEAGDEIDRLNTIIKDKIRYLEAWQGRFKELQDSFNNAEATINTQMQKISVCEEEITRLSHSLKYKA
jgi:predicted  nucleic acid-binding Zn-ribbon protein